MTNETKIQYLQRAGICYIIAGLGYLVFGFPFWFLNAVDTPPKGHKILSSIFLVDKSFPYDFDFWVAFISISSLLVAHISLWKSREPIGETNNWSDMLFIGQLDDFSIYTIRCFFDSCGHDYRRNNEYKSKGLEWVATIYAFDSWLLSIFFHVSITYYYWCKTSRNDWALGYSVDNIGHCCLATK
jgi:hypothetical protein